MTAYYNEIDRYCAQWLRNLIAAGYIAPGDVDERSIEDVRPSDLAGYTQCHFFAGIGVWSYALRLAGWPDDRPVWTGSCPCQPFSCAGSRNGFADQRHLWPAWFHLIRERRPSNISGEQVVNGGGAEWMCVVRDDLEAEGYAVGIADCDAAAFGSEQSRFRFMFMANADANRCEKSRLSPEGQSVVVRNTGPIASRSYAAWPCADGKTRAVEPGVFPFSARTPEGMEQLRAYGNAIAAPCAEAFIRAYLTEEIELREAA
jgi:DNA (cytosine-5)-methyltransferase 1